MSIEKILISICGDVELVRNSNDLIKDGILDSFGMIEFFSCLEDEGISINPTDININSFRTLDSIKKTIDEYL